MKTLAFLSTFVFLFALTTHAQLASQQALMLKEKIHKEIRDAQWPTRNTDQGIIKFLSQSPSKYTALARAARKNDYLAFMDVWASVEERHRFFFASDFDFMSGRTIFHFVAGARDGGDDPRIIKELCPYQNSEPMQSGGYTMDGVNTIDYSLTAEPPLVTAMVNKKFEIAKELVACGADVNGQALATGETPLMYAAKWGHWGLFNFLIDRGADSKTTSISEQSALFFFHQGKIIGANSGNPKFYQWFEENGHEFLDEALIRCKGFSNKGIIQTRTEIFIPEDELSTFEESSLNLQWPEDVNQRRSQKVAKMQKGLIQECLAEGYPSCTVINHANFLPASEVKSEEVARSDDNEAGVRYREVLRFYAAVVGSAEGQPENCKMK